MRISDWSSDVCSSDLTRLENNWPSYDSSRHYEVAKMYSLTEHSMAPELLVLPKRVWDGRPKNEQEIIRKAAKDQMPVRRNSGMTARRHRAGPWKAGDRRAPGKPTKKQSRAKRRRARAKMKE